MNKPVLVLDTNVVLDLLHFDNAVSRPLLAALEGSRLGCVTSAATLDELRRVAGYPELALDAVDQAALLARYRSLAQMPSGLAAVANLPRCSDPDDQKFVELAAAANVHGLVSRDRALLKLRRRCAPRFRVMDPAEAVAWLAAWPALQSAAGVGR